MHRQLSQIGRSSLSFELRLSFEQAAAYRKANGQYVRKNQWRDTTERKFIDLILNENEEIIEYLVYDRLSENEKCELYVLYRSKKNTDGSWHISEAEILDIFAYNVSTKDVVSSGKTSWSATGNEKYYEVTGEK